MSWANSAFNRTICSKPITKFSEVATCRIVFNMLFLNEVGTLLKGRAHDIVIMFKRFSNTFVNFVRHHCNLLWTSKEANLPSLSGQHWWSRRFGRDIGQVQIPKQARNCILAWIPRRHSDSSRQKSRTLQASPGYTENVYIGWLHKTSGLPSLDLLSHPPSNDGR